MWLYQGNSSSSDYRLFKALKWNFGGHKTEDSWLETAAIWWLLRQDTDGYQRRTEKLALPFDKCLSCGGDCVEK
jgi:hypothetical protein